MKAGDVSFHQKEVIKARIKSHEGQVLKGNRHKLYLDSHGNLTGGWGHFFYEGDTISDRVAQMLFEEDFAEAWEGYKTLELNLNLARTLAIVDMIYNMGINNLLEFKNMLASLRRGDYEAAALHAKDSRWYHQTKTRAKYICWVLKHGRLKQ